MDSTILFNRLGKSWERVGKFGDRDAHLPPGEGAIDWIFLVRQLRQWNFHGPLILELSADPESPERGMQKARDARAYLNEVMKRWASA